MVKIKLFFILFILCLPALLLSDALLTLSMGKVEIKGKSSPKWIPAKINMKVLSTDMIRIGKKSKAVLKLTDGSLYTIDTMKVFKLSQIEKDTKSNTGTSKGLGALLKQKGIKIVKNKNESESGVSAVAGVRGADVDNQKNKVKADELKWKD